MSDSYKKGSGFTIAPFYLDYHFRQKYLRVHEVRTVFYYYFCKHIVFEDMNKDEILSQIRKMSEQIIPEGSRLILFGSQARGDARDDSDWDLLILLNKEKIEESDHDKVSYPFFELGWHLDVPIHPILYTIKDWSSRNFSPFYKNVESEGIALC